MAKEDENSNALLTALDRVQSQYNQIGLEDAFSGMIGASVKDLDLYFAQGEEQVAGILSAALGLRNQFATGKSARFRLRHRPGNTRLDRRIR